ncbi:MAG: DUF202 domain-containing protein [Streptosporangiales bacterium]|nr:DUF202 domain-containing protein [Streptosporangiales bacterium]
MTVRETGLQAERTSLSWQRTLAALFVVALLCLRDPRTAPALMLWPAAGVAVLCVAIILRLRFRTRGITDPEHPPAPLAGRSAIVAVSGGVIVLGFALLVTEWLY